MLCCYFCLFFFHILISLLFHIFLKPIMVISCSAFGCTNRAVRGKEYIRFHRFPLSRPDILRKWVDAVKRQNWTPTIYSFLCSQHFRACDYKFKKGSFKSDIRHRLKNDAVPTQFGIDRIINEEDERAKLRRAETIFMDCTGSKGDQTQLDDSLPSTQLPDNGEPNDCGSVSIGIQCDIDSPVTKKLKKKLRTLEQKVRRRNKQLLSLKASLKKRTKTEIQYRKASALLENYFNTSSLKLEFFRNEMKNSGKKGNGQRYNEIMKEFALRMYFYTPKGYEYLRRHFTLPNPSLLRKWVNSAKGDPVTSEETPLNIEAYLMGRDEREFIEEEVVTEIELETEHLTGLTAVDLAHTDQTYVAAEMLIKL